MATKIQKSYDLGEIWFLNLATILYLGYHGNGRHLVLVQPPKAATHYDGYFCKVDHNMAPKPWISIPNIKIYFETKFRPNHRIFVFWWPFWIQNGHHSFAMVTKVQNGRQIQKSSDLGEIWFPSRL
jgi:hypothetical protein